MQSQSVCASAKITYSTSTCYIRTATTPWKDYKSLLFNCFTMHKTDKTINRSQHQQPPPLTRSNFKTLRGRFHNRSSLATIENLTQMIRKLTGWLIPISLGHWDTTEPCQVNVVQQRPVAKEMSTGPQPLAPGSGTGVRGVGPPALPTPIHLDPTGHPSTQLVALAPAPSG